MLPGIGSGNDVSETHWLDCSCSLPSNEETRTIWTQGQAQIQGVTVLESEVKIDDARVLEQVEKSPFCFDVDCLFISENKALVYHLEGIVRICGVVTGLNHLRIAAISKPAN